jgi:hypothetical protein
MERYRKPDFPSHLNHSTLNRHTPLRSPCRGFSVFTENFMPIDASTFLAGLTESRRADQVAQRKGFIPASGLVLPVALEVALRHRLLLTPVLARSRLATTSASIGVPSCERAQIEYWFARYGESANWHLHLGQSGVVAFEVDPAQARYSLTALIEDDDSWKRSLNFVAQGRWHFLFESVPGLPRLRGCPGLQLHAGNSILVPPSYVSGRTLCYEDVNSPILPLPPLSKSVTVP